MKRLLTSIEIESIIDFITPSEDIPHDTAMSLVHNSKERLRKQLVSQLVYPKIIPALKEQMKQQYFSSLIQPGESVGIICAQSIGEKNTQLTLNSVDWNETILYKKNNIASVQPIGQFIDDLLASHKDQIQNIPENRTEYLPLQDGFIIPSCDSNGHTNWYKIEAITRHLPVGQLVKIITQSGRSVTATQSKSFLVWNGSKFIGTMGSEIKVGDIVPTTKKLNMIGEPNQFFEMESIFPKDKYLYTTEVIKARKHRFSGKKSWLELNGKEFTVPYNRPDTCFGKRIDYFLECDPGLIYIHTSNAFVSHIPDKIPLDEDFGFLIGIYLAEGLSTLTYVCISNNDETIRNRVTNFCDRYGVTYHLVTSKSKNVINGESNDLKIHSTLLARMFKIICDTGSENKKIPEFVYTAPTQFIYGLIDGYFSGDGTINKKDGTVSVGSISKNLINGISFLLSYFNIFGRISCFQQKQNNVGSKNIKPMYTLRISNRFSQNFAKNIILTEFNKQEKLDNITKLKKYKYIYGRCQENFPDRDVYFDEVVSVEYVNGSTEYVYDLTVEKTRNFQLWNGLNIVDKCVDNR